MNKPGIEFTTQGAVARVTLARPERRNAFDTAMLVEFEGVIRELEQRREVEVVVLSGHGTAFCAGTDLKELARLGTEDTLHWQRRTGELVERWSRLTATTLTAYNGPAIGSGAIVGLASDLRIATDSTWFSFPEAGYGLPLTWSGVPLLVGLLGADRTKRMLLLQERLDAGQLLEAGLVMSLWPASDPAQLMAEVDRLVARLLGTPMIGRSMAKRATAMAACAPGFAAAALDPFTAALSVELRGAGSYLNTVKGD